ncbi:TCB1 transposase, partial [Polypterus senegalus]
MKSKELSVDLRDRIVSRHKSGEGYRKMSAALKVPMSTVASIIRKWKKFETKRAGRPSELSDRGRRALVGEVTKNPMVTLTELQMSSLERGEPSRRTTISSAIYQSGLYAEDPTGYHSSPPNRKKRLQFAQAHQNWTVEDWKNVAWSDESRFLLRHSNGKVRIWRKQNENMDPSCLVTTVQAGGGGVMVWGMFSWHTLGPLVPIGHRLNATGYLSTVSDHVHPFMTTMYPSSDGYFQQDNAPCHKARIISNWFLEHDNEFTVLKWPPQSPDLNPIEHLWDVVEWELRALDVHPSNLHQLQDAILSIWANISKECFQHLVESMPRRIKAVLKAKGGQTLY